jgi:SAM-dependent methyltransferase
MRDVTRRQFQNLISVSLESLKEKLLLDAGCGMGRYTEVAASVGATVIGFDLSYSIDSCYENLGNLENVHLVQADIFHLPFKDNIFDFVYSFGVLHHTPSCERAFKQLPQKLKKGGMLSIFVYSSYNRSIVLSSKFWRFFTTRLPKRLLYYFSFISVPLYYIYKIPVIGSIGKALFVIPLWPDWRWRVLDTFDWYSPKYQSKHTHWEVFRWFEESGLRDIKIYPGEIALSGTKE